MSPHGPPLHAGSRGAKRAPLLFPRADAALSADDTHIRTRDDGLPWPGQSFALTGPAEGPPPGHLPVRGDLAHIALAGRWFVPHYAVPLDHLVCPGGAPLLARNNDSAEPLDQLADGTVFEVLEISGGWAWGQVAAPAGDGLVGYVKQDRLVRAA